MPAVIPAAIALRQQLRDCVSQALALRDQLESQIAVRGRQQAGVMHGKVDHSPPPWNTQVANALLDLHAEARKMEAWLRLSQKLPPRHRGGSDGNTAKALEAVTRLAENAPDGTVREHIGDLNAWIRRAQIAAGETEIPKRLPRSPGSPETSCPWCKNRTLRMFPFDYEDHGEVRCVNPGCKDEQERRPSARLEYFRGEYVLRWMDGVIGAL